LEAFLLGQVASYFLPTFSMHVYAGLGLAHTAGVEMCDRSAATPGVFTTSYRASSVMCWQDLRSRDRGWTRASVGLFDYCGGAWSSYLSNASRRSSYYGLDHCDVRRVLLSWSTVKG
jgi:hypothetical protein